MPRPSRATGVGRGNGFGSAKTQYKEGMPSGNPHGRPKTQKLPPTTNLAEAFCQELNRSVDVTIENVTSKMPQHQAMVADLFASYPRASVPDKLRIMDMCKEMLPQLAEIASSAPEAGDIEEVMADMKARAMRMRSYESGSRR